MSCDFKIVLLGGESIGKTCLVHRFFSCSFNEDVPYQTTLGASVRCKAMSSNGKKYIIGVWDTAGSERFKSMMPMYYRGAKAAVICYEPSNNLSWTQMKFWLSELRSYAEDCNIYLCGTKKDLLDAGSQREVSEDTIAAYCQDLKGHFLTSSATGENVEEMFQKIVDDCVADRSGAMKEGEELRILLQKTERDKKPKRLVVFGFAC